MQRGCHRLDRSVPGWSGCLPGGKHPGPFACNCPGADADRSCTESRGLWSAASCDAAGPYPGDLSTQLLAEGHSTTPQGLRGLSAWQASQEPRCRAPGSERSWALAQVRAVAWLRAPQHAPPNSVVLGGAVTPRVGHTPVATSPSVPGRGAAGPTSNPKIPRAGLARPTVPRRLRQEAYMAVLARMEDSMACSSVRADGRLW